MAARINPGGGRKSDKLWADALKLASSDKTGDGRKKLRAIAENVVAIAMDTDPENASAALAAAREIGDRLDGKPAQQQIITGDQNSPLEILHSFKSIV